MIYGMPRTEEVWLSIGRAAQALSSYIYEETRIYTLYISLDSYMHANALALNGIKSFALMFNAWAAQAL